MKFPDVLGVYDYAGLVRNSRIAPNHVAFHYHDSVSIPIATFRSSIPSPPVPLFTLHWALRSIQCKTRGRADCYSFLVRLFHPLLHTGLSRRTMDCFLNTCATLLRAPIHSLTMLPACRARS